MMDESGRNVRVLLGRRDRRTDRPGVVIVTPFSQDFIDDLKDIPSRDRAWWPEARQWWVAEEHEADVIALVVHHYGETILVDEDGGETYLDANGNPSASQGGLW